MFKQDPNKVCTFLLVNISLKSLNLKDFPSFFFLHNLFVEKTVSSVQQTFPQMDLVISIVMSSNMFPCPLYFLQTGSYIQKLDQIQIHCFWLEYFIVYLHQEEVCDFYQSLFFMMSAAMEIIVYTPYFIKLHKGLQNGDFQILLLNLFQLKYYYKEIHPLITFLVTLRYNLYRKGKTNV